MKHLDLIAFLLLLIGGINWGLVGLLDYNLVTAMLGDGTTMAKAVYALVGAGALYKAFQFIQKRGAEA